MGLVSGFGRFWFGSLANARAFVRGEKLVVADPQRSLGDVAAGTKLTLNYPITNMTGHPVKILGAQPSCSCMVVDTVPMVLAASETRSIPVSVDTSEGNNDSLSGTVDIFTDEPEAQTLHLTFAGRIVAARDPAPGPHR